jgi:hypothetical protein
MYAAAKDNASETIAKNLANKSGCWKKEEELFYKQ